MIVTSFDVDPTDTAVVHRACGALLGSAAGDALGAPFEFGAPGAYRRAYPEPVVGGTGEMAGGGSFAWALGIDGIALMLIMLSVFLMPICIGASWRAIERRVPEYMAAFLLMEALMIGVFVSLDAVLFYLFFEAILIPMYLIIGIWGGPRRIYAAFKFFLYTLLGSVLFLVAILVIYLHAGTTEIPEIEKVSTRLRTTKRPNCCATCSTPRPRATTITAAISPKIAPEAPTVTVFGSTIRAPSEPAISSFQNASSPTALRDVERQQIINALEKTGWHRGKTAELLGISPSTLYRRLREYDLETR